MFARRVQLWLAVALLGGCAATGGGALKHAPDARTAALADAIAGLGDAVSGDEARRAAHTLVAGSDELRADYRMVRPAQLHNVLVNLGLRERGLCCHFAEDLVADLLALRLRTLDVRWVVARHGSRLREHNSVLLVPRGGRLDDGLVIDAWRRAGELLWTRPGVDHYPWKLHPLSGDWEHLHCL